MPTKILSIGLKKITPFLEVWKLNIKEVIVVTLLLCAKVVLLVK